MMTRAKRGRLESGNTDARNSMGNTMNENRESIEAEQAPEEPEVTRNERESVEIITIDG